MCEKKNVFTFYVTSGSTRSKTRNIDLYEILVCRELENKLGLIIGFPYPNPYVMNLFI